MSGLGLPEDAVRIGKPLDVLGLKSTSLAEVREYAEFLHRTAQDLYAEGAPRRELAACPCCEAPAAGAPVELEVYGVAYRRCPGCGHLFVRSQPAQEALDRHFAESEEASATYVDAESLEVRMREVVAPKVEWLREVYRRERGREPGSALDVGAGGGHVVAALRRAGLEADGHELSQASRRFAREAFGVDLRDGDFLAAAPERGRYDVLTFWGLLEYTPEPRRFLETARRWLDPDEGLLVVEVPRADCLGTEVQKASPETVARHLDPGTHVNCFSDGSLRAALERSGFRPVAAWYFGMDAYELLVQAALRGGDDALVERLGPLVLSLQPLLDRALLCDDIVVAAVPA